MQFVANGPDIPDELLQAHEEGRVVFFCGAGISYPAGLPGFKGLVEKIYKKAGTTQSAIEKEAFDRSQFDATLDLLERRLPGQRLAVRQALAKVLRPKLKLQGATETHEALLRLAHSREGALRLVTTNFDRIFDTAAKRTGQAFQAYSAPMLPIPKNSRWNGLVYLHGLLPRKADDTALNRLVITSGDFGLAYLTERWAARFVSELFRNYVVCFIGYSINDPVLRYMMDALAADRMLGEDTPQAWALGDCEAGQERKKTIEWEAKGVKPILYEVPAGTYDHSALHRTLHAWGETYRDSVLGKERIVVSHAIARPSASTRQDDFVGRMLWALSDKSGLPARRFAEFNPAPSLDWLFDALSQNRYQHGDLSRFGVSPSAEVDAQLNFSLIHRPTPYSLAPRMTLLSSVISASQWDSVMHQLARWLVRHLNDPRLIIWIVEQGGSIHDSWHRLIKDQLNTLARLEQEGKASELAELCGDAPNAVPGPHMRTLWRLLLSGLVRSPWRDSSLYSWKECFKRDGLTVALRFELRELLSPKVLLKKPFRWGEESQATDEPTRIRHLVDWELVLASDSISSALRDLKGDDWESALPSLLEDLQKLLLDALDLICELGEADDLRDRSHWDLPSISPHWQNRGFRDWVALIELVRDAWEAVHNTNPPRAALIAQTWFELPYPTFKRLAFFAAKHDPCIAPHQWVDWLLSDDAWWLWASDTKREVLRLLVLQGSTLTLPDQARLEAAILNGPPRHMFRNDLEPDRWQGLVEHAVWLHLAKLSISGLALSTDAMARLHELSRTNPLWRLAVNERDEFSHWMSGTGDPDYEDNRNVDIAPHKRSDLVLWLKQPPSDEHPFQEDTWNEVCRKHLLNSLFALSDLAREDIWPAGRWRTALQVWSEKGRLIRSWHYAASLIQSMPDAVLLEIAHSVTHWLQEVSKAIDLSHEAPLLSLSRRVMSLPLDAGSGMTRNGAPLDEPVTEAINHPIGHIAQVLLNLWLRRNPNDNDLLPAEIRQLFTQLCNVQIDRYRHARVLLGSRLIVLFRVDRAWTEQHLLPMFNWELDAAEAKAVWEGFLWSPRLYRPLLIAFKLHFLETAHRYSDLGEHAQQFATFLTYAALGPADGYTVDEFRDAIAALPQEGLQESAQALSQALEGAADQREEYWRNRIRPFWQHIWPKSLELATARIAECLSRLSIAAGAEFPSALRAVQDWLRPLEHPHYALHRLHESGLCSQFPAEALRLMGIIIDNQPWVSSEVEQCLNVIEQAAPALARDAQYRRLREYSRQRGG